MQFLSVQINILHARPVYQLNFSWLLVANEPMLACQFLHDLKHYISMQLIYCVIIYRKLVPPRRHSVSQLD